MNWEALGAIGEIVGAVAVVVTLGYLAVQIRQNTRSVRAASHHAVADSFNRINAVIGADTSVGRIVRIGRTGLGNVTEDEQVSLGFLYLSFFRVFETVYYQYEMGTADEHSFQSVERSLNAALSYPGIREWWLVNLYAFTPGFRSHVDQVIREERWLKNRRQM
jgi:hypothetical protein